MCGRVFITSTISKIVPWLKIDSFAKYSMPLSYNVAPTQDLPAVLSIDGQRRIGTLRWGLIPHWAKDEAIGNKLINARAETVTEKPSFRSPFKRKRCVIPIDGFYEWQKTSEGKVPHVIRMKDQSPFALAGLWDTWVNEAGKKISTCTIITTTPNTLMKPIHDRMPVVLPDKAIDTWLDDRIEDAEKLAPLLKPFKASGMEAYPVSTFVNVPRNNSAECLTPV